MLADIDGDGRLDIVETNFTTGRVQVQYQRIDGTFTAPGGLFGSPGFVGMPLRLLDVDADGRPDIVYQGGTGASQTAYGIVVAMHRTP